MATEVDILLVPKISDSTQLSGKSLTISDDTDGTPYRFSGDTINSALNRLADTSGTNTGDQQASDFDIKDLTDSTDLRSTWSGKQDALGFTPENVANKKQTVTNSETDYPSGKAVYDELAALSHNQLRDPNGDPNYQHITTGAQTFTGVKTFSSSPIIPIPTTDYQGAPKKYVADQDALKLDKTAVDVYNVTLAVPLTAGQYYTPTTARAAVPSGVRKRGLELVYETASGIWYTERFVGENISTWTTVTDWEVVPNKKYVDDQDALKVSNTTLETTEEVAAEALVLLKNRIDALQKIISDMILGTVKVDTLSVVKTFNLFGSSNLILTGTAAPAVVPDFIGQFFIKTSATTVCYQATGNSSVNDWKQIG